MEQRPQRVEWWEKLAWQMDEAFRVPGTPIRFGWDAILGLVPGLGEWLTTLVQASLIFGAASSRDIPTAVVVRMILNVAVDGIVGAIPFGGDLFDVFFKANTRNVRLLRQVEEDRRRTGVASGRRHVLYLLGLATILVLLLAGIGALCFLAVTGFLWLFTHGPLAA